MPRPANLDTAFVAECETSFDAADEIPTALKQSDSREFLLELWISGIVLKAALTHQGCVEVLADQILFAHGQLSVGRDPWDVGDYIYEHYKAGFYPLPGEALLQASFAGKQLPMAPVPVMAGE